MPTTTVRRLASPPAQRRALPVDPLAAHGLKDPLVQRAVSVPQSGGRALPEAVQRQMGGAFGADFSSVRVHEGPHASQLGAVAFTQGENVHFAPGQYNPGTSSGQQLLGHELAHVTQQRAGEVRANGAVGGVPLNDDAGLEAKADRAAVAAMQQKADPVQRMVREEEDPAGTHVV